MGECSADPFIFDADAHVLEPPDMWESYLENKYKDRAIKFRVNDKGVEQLYADGEVILPNCTAALGGVNIDRTEAFNPRGSLSYLDGAPPGSMDGAERLVQFDNWGLSAGLVLPTIGILWDSDDNKLADAYCRAYNNWVYDFQAADRNRLVIAANLNFHDIDEAVKELDIRLKQGFKGVFLPPERVDGHAFASDYFDPCGRVLRKPGFPC